MTADAGARVSSTLLLLERSRVRILSSWRTLLGQRWAIAGGSDADDLVSVRKRLATGLLPPVDGRVWGMMGSGRRCIVCGLPIGPAEVEYELQADARLSAHVTCFRLWLEESRLVEGAGLEVGVGVSYRERAPMQRPSSR